MPKGVLFLLGFVLYCFSQIVYAQAPYKIVKNIKGEGWNYRNARLNAFRNALEEAYGVTVESTTNVKNFEAIADTILSTTRGIIQSSYGEQSVSQPDGSILVSFAQVIVSESSKSINQQIFKIAEELENLNCPPIGIQQNEVDSDLVSYLQTFLIKNIGIKVVPSFGQECELVIRPYFRIEQNTMIFRGDVCNKKQEIVSSCANVELLFNRNEDKKLAAEMLVINLLMQFVISPTIKVLNLSSYTQAEQLLQKIRSLPHVVVRCSLKTYQNSTAEYDVQIKGNLTQLCSRLIQTHLFDNERVTMNEFSRVLILVYNGEKIYISSSSQTEEPQKTSEFPTPQETSPVDDPISEDPFSTNPEPENNPLGFGTDEPSKILHFKGFSYLGRKQYHCNGLNYQIDEYRHHTTGIVFASLPPVGSTVPFTFQMGSPTNEHDRSASETQHQVTLSQRFLISKVEVSQKVWKSVMGQNPSFFQTDELLPVETVSWEECSSFCQKTGLQLPTEAQFEYACRGGSSEAFCFGKTLNTDQANFNGEFPFLREKKGAFRNKTTKIGSFPPNAFGLHDMHGNVMEWCLDWYLKYPTRSSTDPQGAKEGSYRSYRNGSWKSRAHRLRSASRGKGRIDYRNSLLGFRLSYVP